MQLFSKLSPFSVPNIKFTFIIAKMTLINYICLFETYLIQRMITYCELEETR
jgi:hypothetical protein